MPTGRCRQHPYTHHYKYLYLPHVDTHDPQPQAGDNLDNRSIASHLQPQQYDRHQVNGSPAQTDLQTSEEIIQKLTCQSLLATCTRILCQWPTASSVVEKYI